MGKKSSAKKHKTTPQKHPKELLSKKIKRVLCILLFVFIGLIPAVFAGFLTFKYITSPNPIADFLPADKTVAYAEINIDENNLETRTFLEMTKSYPFLTKKHFVSLAEDLTAKDFDTEISPWLGRKIGIALVKPSNISKNAETFIFIETKNKSLALDFFKQMAIKFKDDSLLEEKYKNHKVYSYKTGEAFSFVFLGKYIAISESTDSMRQFINGISENFKALSLTKEYRIANKDFFNIHSVHAYINFPVLAQSTMVKENLPQAQKYLLGVFNPMTDFFKNSFLQGEVNKGNLKIKTITEINSKFEDYNEKYSASLASYLPPDLKIFYGGTNLARQINNLSKIFEGADNKYIKKTLKELILAEIKKLLGDSVSLEKNIYPLINNEYAFAIADNDSISIIFKTHDASAEENAKTILNSLKKNPFMAQVQINETVLPDGNKEKTSIEIKQNILFSEDIYRSVKISGINLENENWGIYYAITGDIIIFSSNRDSIKKTIDIFIDRTKSFADSPEFKSIINPILGDSDEIFYAALYKYENLISRLSEYLLPAKIVSMGRQYDGFYIKSDWNILIR